MGCSVNVVWHTFISLTHQTSAFFSFFHGSCFCLCFPSFFWKKGRMEEDAHETLVCFAFWLKLPSCSFSNTHLIAKKCPPCFILFPAKLLTHEGDADEWSDVTPFTLAPIQIDKLQLLIDPHQLCLRYFSFVSFWHLMLFSNTHCSPEFNRVADNG